MRHLLQSTPVVTWSVATDTTLVHASLGQRHRIQCTSACALTLPNPGPGDFIEFVNYGTATLTIKNAGGTSLGTLDQFDSAVINEQPDGSGVPGWPSAIVVIPTTGIVTGSGLTVQEAGVTIGTGYTTINFAAGATIVETPLDSSSVDVTISGGSGSATWTEVEVDFGSTPVYDATFTITDAGVSGTTEVAVVQSGNAATDRADGDALWDSITYAAKPAAGSFTLYALATPGPVVGKRKILYQIGA